MKLLSASQSQRMHGAGYVGAIVGRVGQVGRVGRVGRVGAHKINVKKFA